MNEREPSHEKILQELETILNTPAKTISQFFDLGDVRYHFGILTHLEKIAAQAKAAGLLTPDSNQKILDFTIKIYRDMIEALYKPKNETAPGLLKSLKLLKEENVHAPSARNVSLALTTLEKIFSSLEQLGVDVATERATFEPIKNEAEDLLLQIKGGSPETYTEMYPELIVSGTNVEEVKTLRRMGYKIGKYGGELIPLKGTVDEQRHMRHMSDGVVFPVNFEASGDAPKIQSLREQGRDVVGVILDRLGEDGEGADAICYLAERTVGDATRKGIDDRTGNDSF